MISDDDTCVYSRFYRNAHLEDRLGGTKRSLNDVRWRELGAHSRLILGPGDKQGAKGVEPVHLVHVAASILKNTEDICNRLRSTGLLHIITQLFNCPLG